MTADFILEAVGAVAACVLWGALAIYDRKLPNPAWILAVLLFLHALAGAIGIGETFLNSSLIGPTLLACGVALPVLLRAPGLLFTAVREPTIRIWILFLGYAALTITWSPNGGYGLEKVLATTSIGLLPGMLMYALYRYSRRFSWHSILVVGVLYAALALSLGSSATGRLTTEDANPIWIARTTLVLVAIAIWDTSASWPLRLVAGSLSLWVAVATQSRGPVLACMAASLIVLGIQIVKRNNGSYRRISLAAISAGVGALLVLIVVLPSQPSGIDRGSRLSSLVHVDELGKDANVIERLELQRTALDHFVENPLFGGGIGSTAPIGERLYPHNVPLELAAELGAIGVALWLFAIGRSLIECRDDTVLQVLLLQVVFYSLTSGDLGANTLIVVMSSFASTASVRTERRLQNARGETLHQMQQRALAGIE